MKWGACGKVKKGTFWLISSPGNPLINSYFFKNCPSSLKDSLWCFYRKYSGSKLPSAISLLLRVITKTGRVTYDNVLSFLISQIHFFKFRAHFTCRPSKNSSNLRSLSLSAPPPAHQGFTIFHVKISISIFLIRVGIWIHWSRQND